MLKIAKSYRELSFPQLMEVYIEGNQENGQERFPEEPVYRQLQLAEEDFRQYLQEVFFPRKGSVYALWLEGGQYVSALRLEPYRDGLLLAALETAPDRRRQGYATCLIRAVQNQPGIVRLYSHVGKGNVASRKTHEACGFREISQTAVYLDGSVNPYCCTLSWEKE